MTITSLAPANEAHRQQTRGMMTPQELIVVHRSTKVQRIFHAKGILNRTVNEKYDESFKHLVGNLHPGIKKVLVHDKCAVTIKLHTAFEDEWKPIEKLVFRAISEQLEWSGKTVTIRRRRTRPEGKKVLWPWVRLWPERFLADFDQELVGFLTEESRRAHKKISTEPPPA